MNFRFLLLGGILLFRSGFACCTTTFSISSTSQISPTPCATGQTSFSFETSTHIPVVQAMSQPEPVIQTQPVSDNSIANFPLVPTPTGLPHQCFGHIQNCATIEQEWPYLQNMYYDHQIIFPFLIMFPPCWPILGAAVLYGHNCNPPLPGGQCSGRTISCCQPAPQEIESPHPFSRSARELAQGLGRPLQFSDVIVLWLYRSIYPVLSLATLVSPPSSQLVPALSAQIGNIFEPESIQHHTFLVDAAQITSVIPAFSDVLSNHAEEAFTDIITVIVHSTLQPELYILHQTQNSINILLLPSLFSDITFTSDITIINSQLRTFSQRTQQRIAVIRFLIRQQQP